MPLVAADAPRVGLAKLTVRVLTCRFADGDDRLAVMATIGFRHYHDSAFPISAAARTMARRVAA